jgi:hypothetical protein
MLSMTTGSTNKGGTTTTNGEEPEEPWEDRGTCLRDIHHRHGGKKGETRSRTGPRAERKTPPRTDKIHGNQKPGFMGLFSFVKLQSYLHIQHKTADLREERSIGNTGGRYKQKL